MSIHVYDDKFEQIVSKTQEDDQRMKKRTSNESNMSIKPAKERTIDTEREKEEEEECSFRASCSLILWMSEQFAFVWTARSVHVQLHTHEVLFFLTLRQTSVSKLVGVGGGGKSRHRN